MGSEGGDVQRLEVIDIHQVFVDELPVAIEFRHVLAGITAIAHSKQTECGVEPLDMGLQRWRVIVEADEYPTRPGP